MQNKYKIFYDYIKNEAYRSILVLDGALPEKSFFEGNLPIIAADGAMNSLCQMGIMPVAVVGDLDSVHVDYLHNTAVFYKPDQNSCDFEKALIYLTGENLLPAIIVGVNGGYIDHILNNINIFLQKGSIFYAPPIVGHIVNSGENRVFTLPIHTKISLLAFPEALVSTQGLTWELEHYKMSFPGKNSSFNQTYADSIIIQVHKGSILVMIYL